MNNYNEFIYNKKIITKEQVGNIIDSYVLGESCTKLGKKYNVSHKCILKILHKYNIEVNRKYSNRKYKINEIYFDNIDTPNKAYILGFLYADGNVNIKNHKNTLSISLQEEDGYILELMREEMNSEKPLEYIDYSNKNNFGYHYKNQYRLLVFNKHICESLITIGMVQNKSLVLEFPNIPKELYSHFIRGYFDGDGSFCPHYLKNGKFQPLISFTSTDSFCRSIKNILVNTLNISGGNIYEASCHNGITKVLSLSGVIQTKTILDWLYKDANMFLKRKYNKYINSFYSDNSLSV